MYSTTRLAQLTRFEQTFLSPLPSSRKTPLCGVAHIIPLPRMRKRSPMLSSECGKTSTSESAQRPNFRGCRLGDCERNLEIFLEDQEKKLEQDPSLAAVAYSNLGEMVNKMVAEARAS